MKILITIMDNHSKNSISTVIRSINKKIIILEENNIHDYYIKNNLDTELSLIIIDSSQIQHMTNPANKLPDITQTNTAPMIYFMDTPDNTDPSLLFKLGVNGCIDKTYYKEYLIALLNNISLSHHTIPLPLLSYNNQVKSTSHENITQEDQDSNKARLTSRQEQVLNVIKYGKSNKEVSNILGLSEGTIRTHVADIFNRLNASNRTEAVHIATKLGYIKRSTIE